MENFFGNLLHIKNNSWKIIIFFVVSALLLNAGNFLNSDEGTILNGAWKMYNGQEPYVDFFSFYPPANYYIVKWSFDLLGPFYFSAKIISVFFLLASAWALYGIAMFLFAKRNAALVAAWLWILLSVFPVPLLINYNTYSAYMALIAIYFLTRSIALKGNWNFLFAGLSLGAVMLFLQTKGIFLIVGLSIYVLFLFSQKKITTPSLLIFGFGTILLPLITIAIFGWEILYKNLILWPQENYDAVNQVSWIPFVLFVVLFLYLARRIYRFKLIPNTSLLGLVFISQIVLFLSIFHRPDFSHIFLNAFGVILLFVLIGADIFENNKSLPGRIMRRLGHDKPLISGFIFFVIAIPFSINLLSLSQEMNLKKWITDKGIKEFYAHPFLPGMYFEFGAPDYYPYDVLITSIYPKEAFESNLKFLQIHDPVYILSDYGMVAKFNYSTDNELDNYIFSHYTVLDHLGSLTLLKKTNH